MNPYMQQWLAQNGGLLGQAQGMRPPHLQQAPQMQPQNQPGLMGMLRQPAQNAQPGVNLSPGQFGQWGDLQRRAMTLGNTGRTGNGG